MELKLVRKYLKEDYTIGHLYIDGKYFCDTIEDKVRDYNKDGDLNDTNEQKVYSKTAIPYGRYEVTTDIISPKYSRISSYIWCGGYLPRLLNVPHFEGILIHAGNTASDSAGCLIVGDNKMKGRVINSMATLRRLYTELKFVPKGQKIWITIE